MQTLRTLFTRIVALTGLSLPLAAQGSLVAWDLTDEPGNQAATAPSASAAHVTGLALSRGPGLVPTAGQHSLAATGWHDLAPDDYVELGLAVEAGFAATLSELRIALRASGTGPALVALRSNRDGYSADLATFNLAANTTQTFAVDLSALGRATGAVVLRLVAADGTSASGGTLGAQGSLRVTRVVSGSTTGPVELRGRVDSADIGVPFCGGAARNSTGAVGLLRAFGSRQRSANDIVLVAADLPQHSTGFFLASPVQSATALPTAGLGVLCLRSPIGRFVAPGQIGSTGATGALTLRLDLDALPTPTGTTSAAAGETWHFQAWHRDQVAGAATSNFTTGASVTFE